jgi:hypothetical protein
MALIELIRRATAAMYFIVGAMVLLFEGEKAKAGRL